MILITFTRGAEESELAKFGYKKLVETDMPEYDQETQYIAETYADGEVITKVYEIVNIEYGNEEEI